MLIWIESLLVHLEVLLLCTLAAVVLLILGWGYHQTGLSDLELSCKGRRFTLEKGVAVMRWSRWCYIDWCCVYCFDGNFLWRALQPLLSIQWVEIGRASALAVFLKVPASPSPHSGSREVKGGSAGAKRGPGLLLLFPALNSLFICLSQ